MKIKGQLIDIHQREIRSVEISIENGRIKDIKSQSHDEQRFILPPFIDAHVHIESSMLVPTEFARIAVIHGTVATVSDPHEIANVCGMDGVRFMIENGKLSPFKFYFGASPCVPATTFETSGATLSPADIDHLLSMDEVHYLAEVMNYPGVLSADPDMMEKINIAKSKGKVIDGHAPALTGQNAVKYIENGISTDHECFTFDEGLFKLQNGMKVIIREGSAAKNFEALIPLIKQFPGSIMFCSDDKHPDDLIRGHINQLVSRSIKAGFDLYDTLRAASINIAEHYSLDVGMLRVGDPADLITTDSLETFDNVSTYINGECVAEKGKSFLTSPSVSAINNFQIENNFTAEDFPFPKAGENDVIVAHDGELITTGITFDLENQAQALENDVLQLTVVNRYHSAPPAIALIKNFGLKTGAIASSVAHDSHNIICVGTSQESIAAAVNLIVKNKGGISVVSASREAALPLPVAGLMSLDKGEVVADKYSKLDQMAKALGSTLSAPFMTLSFMALLVIPDLKLSDKGLFLNGKLRK
ncbi:MAG: adenine deaminase [Chitinophagales bacterium]|nr:adenine deaminase [Chitinophagales bacterium]